MPMVKVAVQFPGWTLVSKLEIRIVFSQDRSLIDMAEPLEAGAMEPRSH